MIRESLAAHRVTASRDATQYLVEHLGGDRLLTRSELEKLALYAGDGRPGRARDAMLSVGDSAALALDDAVMAAAEGDMARLERVLDRVFQEGESPVSVVRAVLRHLHRLHVLAARVAAGTPVDEVLRAARPPIFFKHQDSVRRQLGAVARGAAAAGTRPHRQGRNAHETDRISGRNPVPRGAAAGGAGGPPVIRITAPCSRLDPANRRYRGRPIGVRGRGPASRYRRRPVPPRRAGGV